MESSPPLPLSANQRAPLQLPVPFTTHDFSQAIHMIKQAHRGGAGTGSGLGVPPHLFNFDLDFHLRPSLAESLRQLHAHQLSTVGNSNAVTSQQNNEGHAVQAEDASLFTGPRLTLGQLAEQVRAKARAESPSKGVGAARSDDKYEEFAYSVCAPGTERTGRWTREEHERFMEGLKRHGKQWKKVAAYVGTRTVTQTKTHAQKFFQKAQKISGVAEGQTSKRKRPDGQDETDDNDQRKKSERTSDEDEHDSHVEDLDDEDMILTEAELAAAQVLATRLV